MDYREHPVPPGLSGVVDRLWTLEAEGTPLPAAEPVLPDGRTEIIVHFGDAFERRDPAGLTRQADLLVAGQIDTALWLRPTGRVGILGIRLTPLGGAALLDVPQHELAGRTEDARDVSGPLAAWLEEVRDVARTPVAAAAIVCRGLERLVKPHAIDARVARAVRLTDAARGTVDIGALAAAVGLTRRHLERLFREQVGLTPRTFARVRRFQHALSLLEGLDRAGSVRPGTDAAIASGYADQPHFVREFRALAGQTPSAHLLARAELTGVFLERSGPR